MSRPILIRGGRVVDPSQDLDERLDLLIVEDRVARVGSGLDAPDDARVVDAGGHVVSPGFVDLHVHLREPGGEHKETIASGARAAVAGGFTSICAMPNTDPAIDDPAAVGFVRAEGLRAAYARVYPVFSHAEDLRLSGQGVMNEGPTSTALGLQGIPNAAEDVAVARDCILAELTGGQLHICHVSTAGAVEIIRAYKARGARISAEATPHHLTLTDEAVRGYRTEAKMNPPLRSPADVAAVRDALVEGVIDCIATDHAPHHYEEKEREFDDAAFGIVGLETALGVTLRELVAGGRLDLIALVDRLSTRPARIAGLSAGTLAADSAADVVVFDPDERWICRPEAFHSLSRNTPFADQELVGRVVMTIVGGRVVYDRDEMRPGPAAGEVSENVG